MKPSDKLIVLTGPTASGKTAISLEIAKKYDYEIICADSMTVYRGMDIGTDKPGAFETPGKKLYSSSEVEKSGENSSRLHSNDNGRVVDGVKHHLLDIVNPDEEFNVAIFCTKVKEIVADIYSRGKVPILVGGAVMYIDALVYDYSIPEVKPNHTLRAELENKSTEELFKQLNAFNPEYKWTVDRHNKRRLIREIEVYTATGKPLSSQKSKKSLPDNVLYLAVDREREVLYSQIDQRVDEMFRTGLVEEVRELHRKYGHTTSLHSAGYRQVIQYLGGEYSLEIAIDKTKQAHRNYAKRQLTWLRKNTDIEWVKDAEEAEATIDKLLK